MGESAKNHGSSAENKLRGETAGPQCHGLGGGVGSASGIRLVMAEVRGGQLCPLMSGWLSAATCQSCLCCWIFAFTVLLPETPVPHSHLAQPLTSFSLPQMSPLQECLTGHPTWRSFLYITCLIFSFAHCGIIWEETSYFYRPRSLVRAPITKDRLTKEKKTTGH